MNLINGIDIQKIINEIRKRNPYPEKIFIEPTQDEWDNINIMFLKNGKIQDKFFGYWGRHVWELCVIELQKIIQDFE